MQRSISASSLFISKSSCYAALAIAMLGLAACGGGGGDNDNPPSGTTNPPPANSAPTVTAGDDQTITLPTNSVELSGTATDPDNDTLTYAWSANPADGVSFDDAAAAATRATFANEGSYTLTLTVNDGTVSATDTLSVIVNPADSEPPPEIAWPGFDSESDPNHGWVAVAPVEVGMDAARLQEASTYALTGGGAGMIVRYGKLVHQWGDTELDVDIDTRVDLKSTTKSIGSIALAIAIDRGLIALTDTAQSRYAGFGQSPADPTPPDPTWLSQITIQQLATHTAGFAKDMASTVDLLHEPGTMWRYSDGGLNWLADTLTNVLQQDLSSLLTTNVWQPLEITTDDLIWRAPPAGNTRPPIGTIQPREFSAGITANANAMARIGLLFLRKGMWKEQRILSESFVGLVSTPRPETASAEIVDPTGFPSANLDYGLMWWSNATAQLPDVPTDAYWAWGLGDSLIVVIPSLDLVIARVGDHPDSGTKRWRADWDGRYDVLQPFLTPIALAVEAGG
jgi:CubicO group peptidase (beta-lactamase class C family)